MTGFETRKEREDRKSLMRQLKKNSEQSQVQKGKLHQTAFTTIRLETAETAEKAKETSAHSQEACSSTEICSTVQKTHCGRMG